MTSAPVPKISRGPTLPLIWIVPVIAAAIGAWMVFRELRERGPEVAIEFANGSGVADDKTPLVYRGVAVGTVTNVKIKPDFSGVIIRARFRRSAAALATAGTQFWIVHPEIGFSGVSGLETLLTGVRINVEPGRGGPRATTFRGLDHAPAPENPDQGRAFILHTERLGALTPGAPVYYREVKVGLVETSRLADDSSFVSVRIRILKPYLNLVRANTKFWNAGGVSLKVGLLGAEIKSTSIESLLAGGVAFATPDSGELAPAAQDGADFVLNDSVEKEWLKWQPKIPIKPEDSAPESAPRENVVPSLLKP